jgi:hypothetical protein
MTLQEILSKHIENAFRKIYNIHIESIEYQATRKDFEVM